MYFTKLLLVIFGGGGGPVIFKTLVEGILCFVYFSNTSTTYASVDHTTFLTILELQF